MTNSSIHTYHVEGMSCEHCVASVREEVGEVAGVEAVAVELDTGVLEVSGREIDEDAIRAAVEDAGYRVAEAA